MTKQDALSEINNTQEFYVNKLIAIILGSDKNFETLKEIDFTSPTGTGKTVMMSMIINKLPQHFFVITSLSRGQLRYQVEDKIEELAKGNNFIVFGLNEYTKNTLLQADDYIEMLPNDKKIIWIRDEGHIATNRWQEILRERATRIINFSATNKTVNGIQCNFTHTMMLRTVKQAAGRPIDAIHKLLEVKKHHKGVDGYNPCLLARSLDYEITKIIIDDCRKNNLKYINITSEDYDMSDLCRDDNEYDVIINKFKITEGIDLRRCHVIYMDSKPGNDATTVQVIGRARRNALFWREDVDILSRENEKLLKDTRECYIFYNVPETQVGTTDDGELSYSLCDLISIEELKPDIDIEVKNGCLSNGLHLIELENKTGKYHISKDPVYGFNIVDNDSFYKKEEIVEDELTVGGLDPSLNIQKIVIKPEAIEWLKTYYDFKIYDKNRIEYYAFEIYCDEYDIPLDKEHWHKFLELENFSKKVSPYDFLVLKKQYSDIFKSYDYQKYLTSSLRKEKMKNFRDRLEVDIGYKLHNRMSITYDYEWDHINYRRNMFKFSKLMPGFKKYVKYIEYYDYDIAVRINDVIKKNNVHVTPLKGRKYLYSPKHPTSHYLLDEKGINLGTLKMIAKGNKSPVEVTFMSKEDLNTLLNKVSSIREIDDIDTSILNLEELNEVLNLGFTKEEIRIFNECDFPLKRTDKDFDIPFIYLHVNGLTGATLNYTGHNNVFLTKDDFKKHYQTFNRTINDREIAMIGPHKCKYYGGEYFVDKPVTSKLRYYSKFNVFITKKYSSIIEKYKDELGGIGGNFLSFDSRVNSCVGYCVEYYAKIKLFGREKYQYYIDKAKKELSSAINDMVLVRAATLIYLEDMKNTFGSKVSGLVPTVGVKMLISHNNDDFVRLVIELGERTYNFVKNKMYKDVDPKMQIQHDPNMSVNYISGLADFITKDTILDLKCTGGISETHLKQVLSYYYLSTKRDDLNVKRLIVYDAITEKCIEINV